MPVNDEILKNVINICRNSQYPQWLLNAKPSNTLLTLELLFPISRKEFILVLFQKGSFLLRSKNNHSCYVPKSIVFVLFLKGLFVLGIAVGPDWKIHSFLSEVSVC